MLPTKENIAKSKAKKRAIKKAPSTHQKISNSFIENAISKSNLSALKTIYYLSTILQDFDLSNYDYDELIELKIDLREMLKFTELTADTVMKATKQMQETSITFFDEKNELQMGINLLPLYEIIYGKKQIKIKIFAKIAELIINVQKNYTPLNIKDLMAVKNKHSLRLLALLCSIVQDKEQKEKPKLMNLEELNLFFGTKYRNWNEIERKILEPVKEELDQNSKISFTYEPNYENLGRGRPSFKDVTLSVKVRKNYTPKLF